jgi:hypothetical protein
MAQESDIALGVMQIAASRPDGLCTYKRAYQQLPSYVQLSSANKAASLTRPGEEMWQQLVRNIKSHDAAYGNYIQQGYLQHVPKVGYRITDAGRKLLAKKP